MFRQLTSLARLTAHLSPSGRNQLTPSSPLVFAVKLARTFATQPATSFEDAKEKLNTLTEDPGPAIKLQLYGLFKQVRCFRVFLSGFSKSALVLGNYGHVQCA